MGVEFIGQISTQFASEIHPSSGPAIDPDFVRRFVGAHEDAGFDKVLVGHSASSADGLQVAAFAAAHSERLGYLVAHRPGFMAPTMAARAFATLDRFAAGASPCTPSPAAATPTRPATATTSTRRGATRAPTSTSRSWSAPGPPRSRSTTGRVLRRRRRRTRGPTAPAAAHPDLLRRLVGCGLSRSAASTPTCSRSGASRWPRPPSRSPACTRPRAPPAATSAADQRLLPPDPRRHRGAGVGARPRHPRPRRRRRRAAGASAGDSPRHGTTRTNAGSQRLLAAPSGASCTTARCGPRRRRASGAAGNSTALVGTPRPSPQALLDYVDIGATTLLMRGYDPLDDVVDYGRRLLPLVREELARRERVPA